MTNHLAGETSPYLRQHQDNPVDWYPWGDLAIGRARAEDKPIFLSIGYSACHWCHVMAHESFEKAEIAELLNSHFISIKVDREERTDLDDVYMQAVIMMTGHGGWPMSVFLTPGLDPFFGGTYFPPEPRYGMPSFKQVLLFVIKSWEQNKDQIENSAGKISKAIQAGFAEEENSGTSFDFEQITNTLYQNYDWQFGGWGNAPKFPPAMLVGFLIQRAWGGDQRAKEMFEHLLERIAMGGMYDLVGGGFHRYSVDRQWLVPHFEKMLYDNAQLALAYLFGFAVSGNTRFRQVAIQTLEFIQREMTASQGGFYSSIDADSPQGEGRFYTWTYENLKSGLSQSDLECLEQFTSIRPEGNFEDNLNILQYRAPFKDLAIKFDLSSENLLSKIHPVIKKLQYLRSKRMPPGKDKKIIVSWNALAVRVFIHAGLLLERDDFLSAGRNALEFILREMVDSSGKLNRVWHEGKANHPGNLADYTGLILALHAQYEVDFSAETYNNIQKLYNQLQQNFTPEKTFYFDSADEIENLIVRPKTLQDNAVPSGNALAAHVHWLFWNYEHTNHDQEHLDEMLSGIADQANRYPNHYGYWLQIADMQEKNVKQIALVTDDDLASLRPFVDKVTRRYHPYSVIAAKHKEKQADVPKLLEGRVAVNGQPTAYICQGFTCLTPTTDMVAFKKLISGE